MLFIHDFEAMEKSARTNLVNALSGFKSPLLVGSRDVGGSPNVAVFSSVFHLGANPPLMGLVSRPDTVPRDTLENIRQTGVYTLNHLHESHIGRIHQTSARYPREVSEFDAVGLKPQWHEGYEAPFVSEAVLQIALELREIIPVALNGTHLVIGQVLGVWVTENRLLPDGSVDLAGTPAVVGLDAYHHTELLERLAYAKVGRE